MDPPQSREPDIASEVVTFRGDAHGEMLMGVSTWELDRAQELDRAIHHCERQIYRHRADLTRRESTGRDTKRIRDRLKIFELLLAEHKWQRAGIPST